MDMALNHRAFWFPQSENRNRSSGRSLASYQPKLRNGFPNKVCSGGENYGKNRIERTGTGEGGRHSHPARVREGGPEASMIAITFLS
ncbi:hypothetical protein V6N13_059588 [Hibiscus sabdariffa]|uniref:Uncharacterized protein n=1 Tax=Hibiscus sabdariffa TaxID=183260 RepID=A0ABR2GDQ8_9ROSI